MKISAFKVTTGISTHQDNLLSSFPRFLPSLEAGFAYKYDDVSMIDEVENYGVSLVRRKSQATTGATGS